jgi:hypothetical protein
LEQILKKLLLAAVLSLGAIALSTPQAKANELTCIESDHHVMQYNGSTLCLRDEDTANTRDDAYYLVTKHLDEISMIVAQSQDGENLAITVLEIGNRSNYFMMIGADGSIEAEGNAAIYYRYQADVGTMLLAMNELSDSMDLANNLPGE